MSKKPSLTDALQQASDKPTKGQRQSEKAIETHSVDSTKDSYSPPSRQGKKAVTGFFDPAVSRQLKQIALDYDTTVQALLGEALNDLFEKYHKEPIA